MEPSQKNDDHTFSRDERCLMVVGLEGVGKTTLINAVCKTNFPTSDETEGCRIVEEQIGVFTGNCQHPNVQVKLIDTIGMNCKDPGEWQKQLYNKPSIHGIIFYINGSNPRKSALGDLPRFILYCQNLSIPMMFVYRNGALNYFQNQEKAIEIDTEVSKETKEVIHKNLNSIQDKIVDRFVSERAVHQLMDPIEVGKRISRLEEAKVELQKSSERLNQRNEELAKKNENLNAKCSELNDKYDSSVRDFNTELKKFREQLNQMDKNYRTMCEQLAATEHQNKILNVKNCTLKGERITLTDWKVTLTARIQYLITYLDQNLSHISDSQGARKSVKAKKYSASFLMPLLPLYGFIVIKDYDALADAIADVINFLKQNLHEIENIQ